MNGRKEQQNTAQAEPGSRLPGSRLKVKYLLVGVLLLIAGVFLFLTCYTRPVAEVNTMLADVGLPPIPARRTQFNLQTGQRTYIRFSADPNTFAQYVVEASRANVRPVFYTDAPIPPDEPSWFRPSLSENTRMYILRPARDKRTSVWLANYAVNAKEQTVYVILWPKSKDPSGLIKWLRKIFL
ncbi:MAG: hypothetical protein ACYS8Z_09295 [Planctomycetota bacterium]|jgi:hypothetical protein